MAAASRRLERRGVGQTLAEDRGLQNQLDGGVSQLGIFGDEAFQGVSRLAANSSVSLEHFEMRHEIDPREHAD